MCQPALTHNHPSGDTKTPNPSKQATPHSTNTPHSRYVPAATGT